MTDRLPCQVCGKALVPLKDGTSRSHGRGLCPGSRHRLARWPVGQWLIHHGGSAWVVRADLGGDYGDYMLRCVVGTRAFDGDRWLEAPGKTMRVHGEYMHRHGWTPTWEFRVRWALLTPERRARVMIKARWEGCVLGGVLRDWPDLFDPEREQDDDELKACRDHIARNPRLFPDEVRA